MEPIYWTMLLLLGGAVLLVLEFFVPSAGSLGGLAAICLVAAVIIGFTVSTGTGILILILVMIGVPALLALMIKVWPLTPIGRRLFLSPPTGDEVEPYREENARLRDYVGHTGIATTKMLPAGIIRIERRKFDAITDGEAIDKGEQVVVKAVRMKRLVVRKSESFPSAPSIADPADVLSRPLGEFGLESLDVPDDEVAGGR